MAESTLTAVYKDIQQVASLEMGWGRGTSDSEGLPSKPDFTWSAANKVDFSIACKEGYRNFLYPDPLPGENKSHNWSFLYPLGTMTIPVILELSDYYHKIKNQNEELSRLNREKSEFLKMASDYLHKPLGVVQTYADIIKNKAREIDPENLYTLNQVA